MLKKILLRLGQREIKAFGYKNPYLEFNDVDDLMGAGFELKTKDDEKRVLETIRRYLTLPRGYLRYGDYEVVEHQKIILVTPRKG